MPTFEKITHTLADGQELFVIKKTMSPVMPRADDTGSVATRYRTRNTGKSFVTYQARGITYATGARWSTPTKATTWPSDPFDATTYKRVSWQLWGPQDSGLTGWRDGDGVGVQSGDFHDYGVVESEAAGLLDITTPALGAGGNLPVEVLLHGGGHSKQTRMLPRYTGDRLGGVVFVAVEFPLGNLGWFSSNHFAQPHQPNVAYEYMMAALNWIKDNIADFGGDPNNVTITGASSGGADCTALIGEAGDAGLIHRVIAHDFGGGGHRPSANFVRRLGDDFWNQLVKGIPAWGDRSQTIAQLDTASGTDVALRTGATPHQIQGWGHVNRWPVNDGTFVTNDTILKDVIAGRWDTSIPVWGTWAANEASAHNIDLQSNIDSILARVGVVTGADIDHCSDVLFNKSLDHIGDFWQRQAVGAVIYGYPADRMGREFAALGGTYYCDWFDWRTDANGRERAGHASQLAYFFNKPWWQASQGVTAETTRLSAADLQLAYHLSESMKSFCKHGNPNTKYDDPFSMDLFSDEDMEHFPARLPYDGSRHVTTIRGTYGNAGLPSAYVGNGPHTDAWDFFDTTIGY